ncbi:phage integrase SAM-like domain-containing protein [Meiothermus sp. CFH 77666]|uniref:tyrosine-type recombinase/integrase n=1 Tax=Meiothermus sp. CFH 77666 TaxID=2817942 RepID=UPI001FB11BE6|nr:phage integrase SAM-like domain-containing protein [Meiothermus sp. CFH 77666]
MGNPNPRRGKGEGSIFQRKDGRWAASVTVGYGPDGKQRKRWVYGHTRREVAEKLARLLPKAGYGLIQAPQRLRLGEWLEQWADQHTRTHNIRPSTALKYREYLRRLQPLAHIFLSRLTALAIRAFMADLGHLSPSTRRQTLQFLRAALRDAVRMGLIETNPADAVEPPPLAPVRPSRAWSPEQATAFLQAAQTHRHHDCPGRVRHAQQGALLRAGHPGAFGGAPADARPPVQKTPKMRPLKAWSQAAR